ncbi:MAG: 3-deoxy-D-manno-octulosonic acid transferase [Phycisphaerae bacterium]|nr:3-deoxy-D-manno-octulosonic acid transferase [Phycisphaerae bacterium]
MFGPFILYRVIFQNRYRVGWPERLGFVPKALTGKPVIWIHAVSMGEINAIGTLVGQITEQLGDYEIVISSTTDTGYTRAQSLYGQKHRVFFYPYDFTWAVKRAFNRLNPRLCILMELEVWHNFTAIAHRRNIPVMVANGRISSGKGFPRYKKIAPLVRPMFGRLAMALVQDETYAERFRFLGVPDERVRVVGSLKYDTAEVTNNVAGADALAERLNMGSESLVWVAGSTGPGEEKMVLGAYAKALGKIGLQGLRLVIVPRKPERFDEVAELIEKKGYNLLRYSELKNGDGNGNLPDPEGNCVILGDTMGDLRKFYSLASTIFVGRSLVPMGGSDMIEAVGLGKPVMVGPYTENFEEPMRLLLADEAIIEVSNEEQLAHETCKYLLDKAIAKSLSQRGPQVILKQKGATERTMAAIKEVLAAGH